MARIFMVLLTGVLFVTAFAARHPASVTLSANSLQSMSDYVGANACKDCHDKVFAAWSRTKHAKAIDKLTMANRASTCVGCHVTGPAAVALAEGARPTHPNVQCEACHGPGRKHAEAAIGGVNEVHTAKIEEATCTRCHNDTSPHYKPFYYSAMVGLVHR
jgi:nitrate/TMAO reductase-like tetraheme cytochrome c subunit